MKSYAIDSLKAQIESQKIENIRMKKVRIKQTIFISVYSIMSLIFVMFCSVVMGSIFPGEDSLGYYIITFILGMVLGKILLEIGYYVCAKINYHTPTINNASLGGDNE